MTEKTTLKPEQIKTNPDNPRIIKDDNFKKLVQSLKDFPEMATVREVVVNTDHMILGGNMRFKAMIEAGWKEIPVKVVDWSAEKQREFIIKDNIESGEWDFDMLANEWETEQLNAWGLDLPTTKLPEESETEDVKEPTITIKFDEVGQLESVIEEIKQIVEKYNARISVNSD